jgi:ketosteroid isomerase-like protein
MKIRLMVGLVVLVMGFALPTFAQEKNAVAPEVRQQIEAVFAQFQEAYNKHDPAAMDALHTQDAVEVRSWQGIASGREAMQKRFAFDFASNLGKMVTELVQVYTIGKDICAISDTRVGGSKARNALLQEFEAPNERSQTLRRIGGNAWEFWRSRNFHDAQSPRGCLL